MEAIGALIAHQAIPVFMLVMPHSSVNCIHCHRKRKHLASHAQQDIHVTLNWKCLATVASTGMAGQLVSTVLQALFAPNLALFQLLAPLAVLVGYLDRLSAKCALLEASARWEA
jgi:uncharacterized membrane protein YfcA